MSQTFGMPIETVDPTACWDDTEQFEVILPGPQGWHKERGIPWE